MQNGQAVQRRGLVSVACVIGACGAAMSASAQLGAFPESSFNRQSVLPFQVDLAIEARASSPAAAMMLRGAIISNLAQSPMCYRPDLTQDQWNELMDRFQFLPITLAPDADAFGDRFNVDIYRWGPAGTANNTFPSGAAIRTNLTYSFPADGVTWGLSASGFAAKANALTAGLNTNFSPYIDPSFNAVEYGREILRQSLAGWRKYGGITYTEVADSGNPMSNNSTHNAAQGDIRIGGNNYTSSGVLAYNCFPATGGITASLSGGDMNINTFYMGDESAFADSFSNFRYLRNVVSHEHGHGLGFIHQVPCSSSKLMEPFIQTTTDMQRIDDRRAVGRNYGDRYSGNQSLATAVNLGNLNSPAQRSIALRSMSLNGYWNNGGNSTGADYYKFTLSSTDTVKIIATPTGGTYTTGQQSSSCSGTTTSYNSSAVGNLAYVLMNSDGTVTIGTVDATAAGSAETFTFSNLAAGTYTLLVYDNNAANLTSGSNPNTIVQLYDLEIQLGTNVYADPYANAGLDKRIPANVPAAFIGDVNSQVTESRIVEGLLGFEWDLDGDGVFEVGGPGNPVPQIAYTYVSNGVYPVTLRVTDTQGKTGTDTIQVTVYGATTQITGNALSGQQGATVPFTLIGKNFKNLTSASMVTLTSGTGVTVTGTPIPNTLGTQVTGLSFVIDPSASLGGHNVRVVNSDGSFTYTNFLTVSAPPCPADFNHDLVVDDSDFVIFANDYNLFDCSDPSMTPGCPADLNHDGFVDDSDFVIFADAYAALLCP
ncbi:MAG: PKD domain-containing protein [Phycisphaerales bacterium]|nr:hypothetical protein [Planctomycetota bacterium]